MHLSARMVVLIPRSLVNHEFEDLQELGLILFKIWVSDVWILIARLERRVRGKRFVLQIWVYECMLLIKLFCI